MMTTIRVLLPANQVPKGAKVSRIKTEQGPKDCENEFTVQNETILNGVAVQLPETELCLVSTTPGKPSQIVSPETEVVAHLSYEQVQSLMA